MSKKPPIVWLLTDQKPGHLNQLRGLAQRLEIKVNARCHFVDVSRHAVSWYRTWRGINLAPHLPAPDLVIAAGSGCQKPLLATKRQFAKPALLLMRPNFPYAWLDGALVPEHDNPPQRDNVLVTQGVLNAVEPSTARAQKCAGMMLIGGPSKHFGWDDTSIIEQVRALCQAANNRSWMLSDSRRTPTGLLKRIAELNIANLRCYSSIETEPNWLAEQLVKCSPVWVTPDSVSMVYEALTSGAATGLFSLPSARAGRINSGLNKLLSEGRLIPFSAHPKTLKQPPSAPFWEADRAADWVIERFLRDALA